jgi:hypothetical protein
MANLGPSLRIVLGGARKAAATERRVEVRMHATIRRYEGVSGASGEPDQVARQVAAKLSGARGFVLYIALDAGQGILATVSIFEDQDGLEDADRLAAVTLAERLGVLHPAHVQVTTGEIVFQRGL